MTEVSDSRMSDEINQVQLTKVRFIIELCSKRVRIETNKSARLDWLLSRSSFKRTGVKLVQPLAKFVMSRPNIHAPRDQSGSISEVERVAKRAVARPEKNQNSPG